MQDLTGKIPGSQLTAAEWNQLPEEVQNVITNSGIVLSGGDINQLAKALARFIGSGTFYTDSGAADAYVLTNIDTLQGPIALSNGLKIRYIPSATNLTTTPNVNVATLGAKDLVNEWGDPLQPGQIPAGRTIEAEYNLSGDNFRVLDSSQTVLVTSGDFVLGGGVAAWNDVTGITTDVISGGVYEIEMMINIEVAVGQVAGYSFRWDAQGPNMYSAPLANNNSTVPPTLTLINAASVTSTAEGFDVAQLSNDERAGYMKFMIIPAGNATLQFQIFNSATGADSVTIGQNTVIKSTRIA